MANANSSKNYSFSETTFDEAKKLVQGYKTLDLQKMLDIEREDMSEEELNTLLSISARIGNLQIKQHDHTLISILGFVEGVRLFIKHGADINLPDESYEAPLNKGI